MISITKGTIVIRTLSIMVVLISPRITEPDPDLGGAQTSSGHTQAGADLGIRRGAVAPPFFY